MIGKYYLLLVAGGLLSARHFPHQKPRISSSGIVLNIDYVPWQVSVQANGAHHCGGAIYSKNIIITAAHCFYKEMGRINFRLLYNEELTILAGTVSKILSTIYTGVSAKMHHGKYKYNQTNFEYDIGIMKVSDVLPLSKNVKPIYLAKSVPKVNTYLRIYGWGLYTDKEDSRQFYPENLRSSDLQIVQKTACGKNLAKDLLCVGSKTPSACHGDAGGPAVLKGELVGIIVGQQLSCSGPTILIDVSHYHNWLINAIELV